MDPEDLVAADPMMRTLRERHPDVNIVLLPPVEPIVDQPSATPAQCRALQQHADTVLATLSLNVLQREPSTRVDYWWSQHHPEVRRWVTAASYADLGDGAVPMLRAVGNLLVRLGWEPRPAADGSPRMRGVAGPFELIASALGDTVSINITSDPLYIPVDVYDDLRVEA